MSMTIRALAAHAGIFDGSGMNHDGEMFHGTIEISAAPGGRGIRLHYVAKGLDGTLFHEEKSLIAQSPTGPIALWTIGTNHPGITRHDLRLDEVHEDGSRRLTFAFGDRDNTDIYREEITVELTAEGGLGYHYAWAMPGHALQVRSQIYLQHAPAHR